MTAAIVGFWSAFWSAGCGGGNDAGPPAGTKDAAPDAGKVSAPAPTREVTVAAAADLKFAMDEVLPAFRARHPDIAVKITFGSSGNFHTQLANRAPFDLYFSADIAYPRQLADKWPEIRDTLFPYAVGRLVVWSGKGIPAGFEDRGAAAVLDPAVTKVAIANPRHAPYGRAAEAALRKLGHWDAVADKIVMGENVSQTAQFVDAGAAQIGFLALAQVTAPTMRGKGAWVLLPADLHPPLVQGGIILPWAKDRPAAEAFRAFVLSPEGQAVLARFGFEPPPADTPAK